MVSVPARVEDRLSGLDGDGIRLLATHRHPHKLRPGHLRGNRFRILIRDPDPAAAERLAPLLERLRRDGMPNYYGPQRFGRGGETLRLGLELLRGGRPGVRNPFLRKLALSAAQSGLYNTYLGRRLQAGRFRRVIAGDVMAKWPAGGLFVAEDLPREQARFDGRETVHAGPIFGRKTFAARADAAAAEAAVLESAGLDPTAFSRFGKLLQGTRRHNVVYLDALAADVGPAGVRLSVMLPAGAYATVLLHELTKSAPVDGDADGDRD
jgi:tRNA pseudouridine13 synthase